jgi:DMSO/TMAO reductase YedYZ molybdopterin-dependent catalytic subunit
MSQPSRPNPPPGPGDEAVLRRLRGMTRRGFAVAGAGAAVGLGLLGWLRYFAPEADDIPAPLRAAHEWNERLSRAAFSPDRLAPTFPESAAVEPRVNGGIGLAGAVDPSAWTLRVEDDRGRSVRLSLDDLRPLPRAAMTTELKCVEGWSAVVGWAGIPLRTLAQCCGMGARSGGPPDPARPDDLYEYVSLETPGGGYYVGLDMASALHPQTLLCDRMNGAPLTPEHGAPLRLAIPLKYGIKNIKRIGLIRFTDARPRDYWAERGYDWYAGH